VSTTEVAAVVVAAAAVVGVVVMTVLFARLNRTVRTVGESVQQLRFESVPIAASAREVGPESPRQRSKAPKDAGVLVAKVARANPILDVSQPVIKVLALASGTGRAASRLRRRREQ
jgi:hypothetical protein